jgi:Tfp pilus assembly PilM family ATPase
MNIRSILRQPLLTVAIHEREARWTLGLPGRITAYGATRLPVGMVDDGVILDSAAAGLVLRESADFPGSSRMRVVIALPAQRSVVRQIELPMLRGRQFAELVERETRREMSALADNAYVSWKRTGVRDGKAQVFVVGVARDVLDSHAAAIRAARLRPFAADLRIIAAARALGQPDCIIANIEEEEIEIGIFRGGVPAIMRFVAMSSSALEQAWSDQITEELARTLKFYRDSRREDDVVSRLPIMLVGGAAQHAMITSEVVASTGHEVGTPSLRLGLISDDETVRFAANIGLALKDLAA